MKNIIKRLCSTIWPFALLFLILYLSMMSATILIGFPGPSYAIKVAKKYTPIVTVDNTEFKEISTKTFPFNKNGEFMNPMFYVIKGKDKNDNEVIVYISHKDAKIYYIDYE
ncbi:hypothetical protein [Lutispora saccharofermentans]|uniref:Uncharacterized protein n=1 Tax=Lutispora saccharofermentans TaxID=3024236 RepID=A0ABT1NN22_9FIRM|nr:hypothetical protein [Lutispora saccharofermentans]MCQ1531513.1 hypothetical protein [Lutispora saccharofermentans]